MKASDWMPIETAPNGPCELLTWCKTDEGGQGFTLYRDHNNDFIFEGEPTYCLGWYLEPTHWQPIVGPDAD